MVLGKDKSMIRFDKNIPVNKRSSNKLSYSILDNHNNEIIASVSSIGTTQTNNSSSLFSSPHRQKSNLRNIHRYIPRLHRQQTEHITESLLGQALKKISLNQNGEDGFYSPTRISARNELKGIIEQCFISLSRNSSGITFLEPIHLIGFSHWQVNPERKVICFLPIYIPKLVADPGFPGSSYIRLPKYFPARVNIHPNELENTAFRGRYLSCEKMFAMVIKLLKRILGLKDVTTDRISVNEKEAVVSISLKDNPDWVGEIVFCISLDKLDRVCYCHRGFSNLAYQHQEVRHTTYYNNDNRCVNQSTSKTYPTLDYDIIPDSDTSSSDSECDVIIDNTPRSGDVSFRLTDSYYSQVNGTTSSTSTFAPDVDNIANHNNNTYDKNSSIQSHQSISPSNISNGPLKDNDTYSNKLSNSHRSISHSIAIGREHPLNNNDINNRSTYIRQKQQQQSRSSRQINRSKSKDKDNDKTQRQPSTRNKESQSADSARDTDLVHSPYRSVSSSPATDQIEDDFDDVTWFMCQPSSDNNLVHSISITDGGVRLTALLTVMRLLQQDWRLMPISGYLLQTVMLHEMEVAQDCVPRWQRQSLESCVRDLLSRLHHFIYNKCLPHFHFGELDLCEWVGEKQLKLACSALDRLVRNDTALLSLARRAK